MTDLPDGEVRIGGSFRTTLKRGPLGKFPFSLKKSCSVGNVSNFHNFYDNYNGHDSVVVT